MKFDCAVRHRARTGTWLWAVPVLLLSACRSEAPAPAGDVVARFGEHVFTAADVDARVLSLSAAERPAPGADLDAWYRETLREMAVDAVLKAEAEDGRLEADPAFQQALAEAERQIQFQSCLGTLEPQIERVTDEDVRAAYDEKIDGFRAEERRFVYHLFLRRGSRSDSDLQRQAEALRERGLRGESFPRLASAHSESESRHADGAIGWVTRGVLPEGFEKVVFSLVEGVPSEPVMTRDGAHLFFVDQALSERTLSYEEVRGKLAQWIYNERRAVAIRRLEAEVDEAAIGTIVEVEVQDAEALAELAKSGDPEAVVLRVDDRAWTITDLRRAARAAGPSGAEHPLWVELERARRRAVLHAHCLATGKVSQTEVAERLERWREEALLNAQRRRRLVDLARQDEERLRLFYESNIGDFSSRPQWHLRRLSLPLGGDPPRRFARLEAAASKGPESARRLESLVSDLGGEILDSGFLDANEIAAIAPKLPGLVTAISGSGLTPPYRLGDRIEIAQVVERKDAEARPFEEVRDRVLGAYVDQYTPELYEELTAKIFASGPELEIDTNALAKLRQAGLPQPEVSVDDLEALFEEL